MKAVCISCFNSFGIHAHKFTEYFTSLNYDVKYLIQDYDHVRKKYLPKNYPNTDVVNIHVPSYTSNLSPKRMFSHYIFSRKVYKFLCDFKPDIIYCMFPPNTLVKEVAKYKRKFGAKIIFDWWDSWPESFPFKEGKRYALLKPFLNYWRNLRENYIQNADLLLSVSKDGLELLQKKYPNNKCELLRPSRKAFNPEDLPKYDFSKIEQEISFCYLGNVNFITDLEFAEELFGKLTQHKKISIHIIGEGTNFDRFVEILKSKGVEVFTHGIVYDDKQKCEIFSKCQIGLSIPRKSVGSTMPLKVTEYIRAGMPLINTASGDIYDLIKEYNFGFNASNPDEIANKLLNITPQELQNMNNNCVENYKKVFNPDLSVIMKDIL